MKKVENNYKIMRKSTNIPREFLISTIYPNICGVCGKINNESLCKKCELLLNEHAKFIIEENYKEEKYFTKHLYIFQYEGIIRRMILNYKFNEKSYLYKTFVNFLLKNEKFFKILNSYDTIIPVPISKQRRKERGYNQSELIAKELSKYLQGKYEEKILIKTKNIIAQSKLNKEQRQKNIKDAYKLFEKEKVKNKKVLLIDDIYTTGNTVNECCKTICNSNVKKIDVLTIAKD